MIDTTTIPITLDDNKIVKLFTDDVDITAYWHTSAGGIRYIVIDIDSDSEADVDPSPIQIYRNDGQVYSEGVT